MILFHIHDERARPPASRRLGESWTIVSAPLEGAADIQSCEIRNCLLDVDVTSLSKALRVRALMARLGREGARLFACSRGDHHATTQARALGATAIVDRPIRDGRLLELLGTADPGAESPASSTVGAVALDLAFGSIREGKAISPGYVEAVAGWIAADIGRLGIDDWLDGIRAHHVGTYQHCLIVTGLAAAFARRLGLSAQDTERLTVAALLHDIGKACIPTHILDKEGALTAEERAIVETHPVVGAEHVRRSASVDPDVVAAVLHHHELLDGSGYPDRLRGDQISDLTRLLTIVDIFGALIEQRSYKPPMPGDAAFAILRRMAGDGKLEASLVEAFRPVTAELRDPPAARRTA